MTTPRTVAVGALTVEDVNRALADLQQQILELTGALGAVTIQENLTVRGTVSVRGGSVQIVDGSGTTLHGFGDKDE